MPARRVIALVTLVIAPVGAVLSADLTTYIVLTTDYVRRGVSLSDSHIAGQLGVDAAFESGLYAGVWASTVDISNGPDNQRDFEASYYLGYSQDVGQAWSLGANVVAYTYPGAKGNFDYDYVEYSLSANYDDRYWLEYAYSPDLFHTGFETHNIELSGDWPFGKESSLSAGIGHYDVSRLAGEGYSYWHLGAMKAFGRFDWDIRYHDTDSEVPIVSTRDRADSRIVLSVRLVF